MEKVMKTSMVVATTAAMVVVVVVMMINDVVVTADEPGTICNLTTADLMECKPAVSGREPTPPTDACCGALKGANMTCLCEYKDSTYLTMFGIDPNLALQLPSKCSLPPPACL